MATRDPSPKFGLKSGSKPGSKPTRDELRASARRRRMRVQGTRRHRATRAICAALVRHRRLHSARCVALYLACGSEVDIAPVLRTLTKRGCRTCLPRVRGQQLEFIAHREGAPLRRGAFGLQEPVGRGPRVGLRQIDLAIVPLVGFDARGGRLGQGGGYYDRSFARRKQHRVRHPYLIGVGFAAQRLPCIDMASWDVRMDLVVHDTITADASS